MTARINLTYCGMDGTGATVKEARANAAAKIETLLSELGRAPNLYLMQVDEVTAIVARDAHGWGHRIIAAPSQPLAGGMIYISGGHPDSDDALRSCAHNVLQAAWNHEIVDDALWLSTRIAGLPTCCRNDKRLASNLMSWATWQRDYRRLRGMGLSDSEAHNQARSATA